VSSGPAPLALPLPELAIRRPALFDRRPFPRETALGALFAPSPVDEASLAVGRMLDAAARRLAGPLAPALRLLPQRERERAGAIAAWVEALFATAAEGDAAAERLERLNRSAFLVARALAGENVPSPFARRLALESRRRTLPRKGLDSILAQARAAVRQPMASTPEEWEIRSVNLSVAIGRALLGAEPTPATIEAGAAFARLVRLMALGDPERTTFHLPVEAPPTLSGHPPKEAMIAAIAEECEEIHPVLLRGAKAVGEVPLTFRAFLAAATAISLRLLGKVEAHPEDLLRGRIRLGALERFWVLREARRARFS